MKLKLGVAFASVVLTAGCSSPPESGYVERLHFYDRWVQVHYDTSCAMYNSKSQCMFYTTHVWYEEWPPRWCLYIRDDKDQKHKGDVCVDPTTYAKFSVGMHYPDPR